MSPAQVQWVRRDEPAHAPTAGWNLLLNGVYRGVVWLDGSYTGPRDGICRHLGSQPLAAHALLRAAGVER